MGLRRTIPPAAAWVHLNDFQGVAGGLLFGNGHIEKLGSEIREYFGVKHAFLVSSGKAALALILLALKSLSPKREVLIPAYTCFSVPSSIVKAGLRAALCDVDPTTLGFDDKLLEKAITEDTLCVVPSHLFGIPQDMDRINRLCRERGIYAVEDAAQAMGGTYKGKKLGTLGDVGFFSLGRGKNVTCGAGGIIVTNSDQIAGAIRRHYANLEEPGIGEVLKELFKFVLMTIFIHPALYGLPAGMPFLRLGRTVFYEDFPIRKLSGAQAALLKRWRERLEQSNRIRVRIAAYFRKRLGLQNDHGASVPYLRLPVLMRNRDERDRIFSVSQRRGLGISLMYPTAIDEIEEIKTVLNGRRFPSATKIAETLLTLPTHHLVSERDRAAVCELLLTRR